MTAARKKQQKPARTDNRTGVATAPDRAKSMLHEARASHSRESDDAAELRIAVQREASTVGTMPPMVAPKKGTSPVLLDKLGERLAFERTGARLYELLMLKLESSGGFGGGPSREELEHIRDEELEHFGMLSQVIGSHGGDPTAITPLANLSAVESAGLLQVLSDPRTSLADGLHALLVAELVDHDAWEQLVTLARDVGDEELVQRFERALIQEREHLDRVRQWVGCAVHERLSA